MVFSNDINRGSSLSRDQRWLQFKFNCLSMDFFSKLIWNIKRLEKAFKRSIAFLLSQSKIEFDVFCLRMKIDSINSLTNNPLTAPEPLICFDKSFEMISLTSVCNNNAKSLALIKVSRYFMLHAICKTGRTISNGITGGIYYRIFEPSLKGISNL